MERIKEEPEILGLLAYGQMILTSVGNPNDIDTLKIEITMAKQALSLD